jgi:hypothetical protein
MSLDGTTTTVEHDGFSVTSTDPEDAIKAALGVDAPVVEKPAAADDDVVTDDEPKIDAKADAKPEQKAAEQPRDADGKFTRKDWQKRVDTVTHNWRQTERERDALRAELDTLRAPKVEPKPADTAVDAFPTWETWSAKHDGKGYEDYLDERADWRAERKANAILTERDEKARTDSAQRQTLTVLQKLDQLGTQAHTDFRDAMTALHEQQLQFAPHLAGIIAEELDGDTPLGHELAYYLATHPDDLRRLNSLPPLTAARHVQKILDTFTPASRGSGVERPAVSQAKPPTKPIGAGPSADPTSDPGDDEPVEKYIARMNAKEGKATRLR